MYDILFSTPPNQTSGIGEVGCQLCDFTWPFDIPQGFVWVRMG